MAGKVQNMSILWLKKFRSILKIQLKNPPQTIYVAVGNKAMPTLHLSLFGFCQHKRPTQKKTKKS